MTSLASPFERLAALDAPERESLLDQMAKEKGISTAALKMRLLGSWRFTGRPKQQPPPGPWLYWWLRCGRGFGKTISAAQWVKTKSLERRCRFALIGPTRLDVSTTMVEGESGLLSILPAAALLGQSREIAWNKTTLELTLANGTILTGFSSERPDRLRGPEHDYIWGEEVSSWRDASREPTHADTTWSNMMMTLRAASDPRVCLTSTPKPNKLTRALAKIPQPRMRVVTGSSFENQANLSDIWWDEVVVPVLGTRTGRQEIEAELLEDVEGALWTRLMIDTLRVEEHPPLSRIVVGVDPNTTSGESADAAGIVVAGRGFKDRHGYILEDRTQTRGGPSAWAQAAVDAYHHWQADRIVVEVNNGGEMCEMVIKGVDPSVPVEMVRASQGKRTRAEPISALYEASEEHGRVGRVHHVGSALNFGLLEEEMCEWTPEQDSPNRLDALVWACWALKLWTPMDRRGSFLPQGEIPGADIYEQTVGGSY